MTGDSRSKRDDDEALPAALFWNFIWATVIVLILAWLFTRDTGISLW